MKYEVKKCRHGRCLCWIDPRAKNRPWRVQRRRGLEVTIMSYWAGQAAALEAALELAGLAPHVCGPTC